MPLPLLPLLSFSFLFLFFIQLSTLHLLVLSLLLYFSFTFFSLSISPLPLLSSFSSLPPSSPFLLPLFFPFYSTSPFTLLTSFKCLLFFHLFFYCLSTSSYFSSLFLFLLFSFLPLLMIFLLLLFSFSSSPSFFLHHPRSIFSPLSPSPFPPLPTLHLLLPFFPLLFAFSYFSLFLSFFSSSYFFLVFFCFLLHFSSSSRSLFRLFSPYLLFLSPTPHFSSRPPLSLHFFFLLLLYFLLSPSSFTFLFLEITLHCSLGCLQEESFLYFIIICISYTLRLIVPQISPILYSLISQKIREH